MPTATSAPAEMVRVAAQCGEDDACTVWSEEEHRVLLDGLARYAEDDRINRCFKIALDLPKKTALDVALRCRWLEDKRKTAEHVELVQKHSPKGKVKIKSVRLIGMGKRTKGAKANNNVYPLSKEALDSRSTKELIQDNDMFLKQIEENLKTGQLDNTVDYFSYVKTNMDAIEKRRSKSGISMIMPPIDEEGLGEILQSCLNLSGQREEA